MALPRLSGSFPARAPYWVDRFHHFVDLSVRCHRAVGDWFRRACGHVGEAAAQHRLHRTRTTSGLDFLGRIGHSGTRAMQREHSSDAKQEHRSRPPEHSRPRSVTITTRAAPARCSPAPTLKRSDAGKAASGTIRTVPSDPTSACAISVRSARPAVAGAHPEALQRGSNGKGHGSG